MTTLPDADRRELWDEFMRRAQEYGASIGLTQAELRAAFDAVDAEMDAAAATINGWFPQPARSVLGVRQKAFMVGLVAMRRALRS